jgi:hypothetical protein
MARACANNLLLEPSIPDGVCLENMLLSANVRARITHDVIVPAPLQRYQTCVSAGEATLCLPVGGMSAGRGFADGEYPLTFVARAAALSGAGGPALSFVGAGLNVRHRRGFSPSLRPGCLAKLRASIREYVAKQKLWTKNATD